MTIVPVTGSLTYSVEVHPSEACPGARVELIVHAHNSGARDEMAGVGILIGPIPHIALGEVGPFAVPAGGDGNAPITITVPILPPGQYPILLLGGSSASGSLASGSITVKNPSGT